jgi:hypothetical protein
VTRKERTSVSFLFSDFFLFLLNLKFGLGMARRG